MFKKKLLLLLTLLIKRYERKEAQARNELERGQLNAIIFILKDVKELTSDRRKLNNKINALRDGENGRGQNY